MRRFEIASDDDTTGRLVFGDSWEQVKALMSEPGVYEFELEELSASAAAGYAPPMTIKPTTISELTAGYTVRVEGDAVAKMRDALERGAPVQIEGIATLCTVVTCSLVGEAGFFEVVPASAPVSMQSPPIAPVDTEGGREVTEDADPTAPGRPKRPRSRQE